MDKYRGCHASRNDRVRTQTNSLGKLKVHLRSNSKKEGISCVTNIVLAQHNTILYYDHGVIVICIDLKLYAFCSIHNSNYMFYSRGVTSTKLWLNL